MDALQHLDDRVRGLDLGKLVASDPQFSEDLVRLLFVEKVVLRHKVVLENVERVSVCCCQIFTYLKPRFRSAGKMFPKLCDVQITPHT